MKPHCLTRMSMVAAFVACIVSVASADVLLVEGSEVRRYSDDGTFLGTFVAGLDTPLSVARSEASGDLFVSQHATGEIRKYDAEGVDLGPVLAGFADWQPAGLAWNDGRLYAASVRHQALASYVPDAGAEDGNSNTPEPQSVLEGLPEAPNGLCSAGARGGVYFTTSDELAGVGSGKGVLGYWSGTPGSQAQILCAFPEGSRPRGVALAEGELFVALLGTGKVVKVDREGMISDWLTDLVSPVGLALHAGRLYVSLHLDRTVKAYALSNKSVQTVITARNPPQYFAFVPTEATALAEFRARPRRVAPVPATPATEPYPPPAPAYRMAVQDAGRVLRHGDGPGQCDANGARNPSLMEEDGTYYLFYDGAGPTGFINCLATSTDLIHWEKRGFTLTLGAPGEADAGFAGSPWFVKEGGTWHMFYVTSATMSGPPELIGLAPYNSMKATATSLRGPWTKMPGFVPLEVRVGAFPEMMAYPGHIVSDKGEYLMFFGAPGSIGMAKSRDLGAKWEMPPGPVFASGHYDIENSSLYFEPANQTWFMFVNHINGPGGYTDATYVFWTTDIRNWDGRKRAVVLDGTNCTWSTKTIGMATVQRAGDRLAMVYDSPGGDSISHTHRDIGLAWLQLPLVPPDERAPRPPVAAAAQAAPGPAAWLQENARPGAPVARVRADLGSARLSFLSWDTEGGDRATLNLLRAPVTLSARAAAKEVALTGGGERRGKTAVVFRLAAADAQITWTVRVQDGGIRMGFSGSGPGLAALQGLSLTFPLDPTATATVPLADEFARDGGFQLPALVYAPDLGAMRVRCAAFPTLAGSWQGSRQTRSTTLTLDLPVPAVGQELVLSFEPWHLPQPAGVTDAAVWQGARRGWLNLLQVNTHRPNGDFAHAIAYPEEPGGVWANNLVSDPVGSTVFWLADHVLLIPQLAPDVSATALLRRTVELWINDGVSPEGQVYYVWRGGSPADSNPAVLIGAWAYVEATGDLEWFQRHAERLEFVARYLENRDVDGDGLVESPQSGNRDSHSHGETAWDCISSGHKNAYVNALAYRAWRGLARLQERAGRPDRASHFRALADRLKMAYRDTFYNAETGWLGWWRSADGELHDLWSDMPTSLAILYGLLTPEEGRPMLDRYWAALERTGFSNFELGLPLNLRPIPPALMLTGFGGKLEDGSDNYGKWLNGGLCLSNTSFWLAASLMVGQRERADRVLNAMLARQARSVFPNGGSF